MSVEQVFNTWLIKKLESYRIDDEVFASYISSIITSEDADLEKKDTLRDILQDVTQGVDTEKLCGEIMDKWSEIRGKSVPDKETQDVDIVHKVALIMEKQAQPVLRASNRSCEEEKLREAILSRCTFVSSDEEVEDSDDVTISIHAPQNSNAEAIVQAEKEKREKMKSEAEKKKVQDKVNRDKQKQKQEERREKERKRTQKREHKR